VQVKRRRGNAKTETAARFMRRKKLKSDIVASFCLAVVFLSLCILEWNLIDFLFSCPCPAAPAPAPACNATSAAAATATLSHSLSLSLSSTLHKSRRCSASAVSSSPSIH